jgi:hypothetical protein
VKTTGLWQVTDKLYHGNLSGRGFSVMGFPTSDKHPSGLFVWGIYVAKYFEKYIITTYR